MDYYIVINGQKQGPYDLLDFIKKVKNGVINAETLASASPDGPFVRAVEFNELKDVFISETRQINRDVNIKPSNVLNDGIELWTRRVVEYTLLLGVIVVIGFLLLSGLKKIALIADYSYIADYIVSTVTVTLLGMFFYFVLLTKRSQDPGLSDIKDMVKGGVPRLLVFSAIMAISVVVFGINQIAGVLTIVVMLFVSSFLVFVPFLIMDHKMPLFRSIKLSLESFKVMTASNLGMVFIMVGINIFAAVLPAFLGSDLLMLALILTLPITVSVLAYIYDQVLA